MRQNYFYAFYSGLYCVRESFGSPCETHGSLVNGQSQTRRTSFTDAASETTNSRNNRRRNSESAGISGILFDCFFFHLLTARSVFRRDATERENKRGIPKTSSSLHRVLCEADDAWRILCCGLLSYSSCAGLRTWFV